VSHPRAPRGAPPLRKYPEHTQRVVEVYVAAFKWLADRQSDSAQAFQLWTRSGVRSTDFEEDWQGDAFKERARTLLDPYGAQGLVRRSKTMPGSLLGRRGRLR
jgi:hypothetical protein